MRFFNINGDDAHTVYHALVVQHTSHRREMIIRECHKLLSHSLMQRGPSMMRKQAPEPAAASRSLVNVFDTGSGRKVRSDNRTEVARGTPGTDTSATTCRLHLLRWKQARAPWRVHQSVPCDK